MATYKFSELVYVPNDYEALQKQLHEYTESVVHAASVEQVEEALKAVEERMDQATFAYMLAYIRSSLDCMDRFYGEAAQKEGMGMAQTDTSAFYGALLKSPFLPQLEMQYGSQFRPRLEKEFRTGAAGHELMAREQALIASYQQKKAMIQVAYSDRIYSEGQMAPFLESTDRQVRLEARQAIAEAFLAQKEELAGMLLELISLRDSIAKANGYDNYLEYANTIYDRCSYGEAEMTAFCEQVKTELVPLLEVLNEERRQRLGLDQLMSYDRSIYFADGNARPAGDAAYLTAASQKMYDTMSPRIGDFFREMVNTGSLDVTASPNKVAGMGFCASVKRGLYPFVFGNCNGTNTDVVVFTHEIGHAWQGYMTAGQGAISLLEPMALDVVEIPSKTMELFIYPYAECFFGEDADKFRYAHFRGALEEIAAYCAIHELNTWIYTHVGASFEELLQAERAIKRQYYPSLDHGQLAPFLEQGSDLLRNMAVYMFPRYVISYALSEMCAMDLFARMQQDPKGAWEAYERLCASGGTRNYPDTLALAGLEPAYVPGRVGKIVAFAKEYLGL